MTKVVIVGKTRAGRDACVGALDINTGRAFRLCSEKDYKFWPINWFELGQVHDLTCIDLPPEHFAENPHHTEDVLEFDHRLCGTMTAAEIMSVLNRFNLIVKGSDPRDVFKYEDNVHPLIINEEKIFAPEKSIHHLRSSVGFWRLPFDLNQTSGVRSDEINYTPFDGKYRIKFVGFQSPIQVLPMGMIIRLSISSLWKPPDLEIERRAYLQISGWLL